MIQVHYRRGGGYKHKEQDLIQKESDEIKNTVRGRSVSTLGLLDGLVPHEILLCHHLQLHPTCLQQLKREDSY
jgi:hypothetical protein